MGFITWVDILVIVLIVWGFISGKKKEFLPELLVLFGYFLTIFIVLHYFVDFGKYIHKYLLIPSAVQDFIGFCLLMNLGNLKQFNFILVFVCSICLKYFITVNKFKGLTFKKMTHF